MFDLDQLHICHKLDTGRMQPKPNSIFGCINDRHYTYEENAMQVIYCAECSSPFAGGVPELINNTWYARCKKCGADIELSPKLKMESDHPTLETIRYPERSGLCKSGFGESAQALRSNHQ